MTTNYQDDLDLLETLLDGELDEDAAERLRKRLAGEPALAAELARLEGARVLRARAIASYEGPAEAADVLSERVLREVRRQERMNRMLRLARPVSGAAACVVVGLMLGRGMPTPTTPQPGAWQGTGLPAQTDPTTAVQPVANGTGRLPGMPLTFTPRPAEVALTDAAGRVVAVQRFASQEDAARFVADLNAAQARRLQTVRPAMPVSPVVPASTQDRF